MKSGIYRYTQVNNPYDVGTLIVEAKETDESLCLKIIEKQMRFDSYVSVLFGEKEKIRIKKEKCRHAVYLGKDWFCVYPDRAGTPLMFDLVEERAEKSLDDKRKDVKDDD